MKPRKTSLIKDDDIKIGTKTEFVPLDFLKQEAFNSVDFTTNSYQEDSDIPKIKKEEDLVYFASESENNEKELKAEFFYKTEDIKIEIKDPFIFADSFNEEDSQTFPISDDKQAHLDYGTLKKEEYLPLDDYQTHPKSEIKLEEDLLGSLSETKNNEQDLKREFFYKAEDIKIEIKDEFTYAESFTEEENEKFSSSDYNQEYFDAETLKKEEYITPNEGTSKPKKKSSAQATKNIVKNFGRAMINFALSHLSYPYLSSHVEFERISFKEFILYFTSKKDHMDGISSLRGLLLVSDEDTEEIAAFKRIFQYSCEVFLKMFCVNWICHSKLMDKMMHLKSRFKILRRIRDPKHFTYFK